MGGDEGAPQSLDLAIVDRDRDRAIVDLAIVDELQEIGALAEAFACYRLDAPAMAAALGGASAVEAKRIAHGLKGASVNLGCIEVAAVCAEIERAGGPASATLVARLDAALARAITALDRITKPRG
jgi:HPt (histidine-containing phosphotransfer) domain-containing protein